MARDVVFTFFATPGKDANVMQPVGLFKNPPLVFPVGTNGKPGKHPSWTLKRENGRALPALLRAARQKCGDTIGRVAVVGFSAGRTGVQQLLTNAQDRAAIDTVLDLDGLHLMRNAAAVDASLAPWVAFGKQCFDASHCLALLHTAIVPENSGQIYSTTESNNLLYQRLAPVLDAPGGQRQPWSAENLTKGPPPPAVTVKDPIWGANGKVVRYDTVTYSQMPPLDLRAAANYFTLAMPGTRPADHIFAANWGQRALWQTFLAPRWNMQEGIIASFDGMQVLQQTTRVLAEDFLEGPQDWFVPEGPQDFAEGVDEPYEEPGGYEAPDDGGGIVRPLLWLGAAALATYAAYRLTEPPRRR
jgi:hypothetical protein